MKRVEFNEIGGTEVLNIVERDIPTPTENELTVKIKFAGLNRAEELFFQGQYLFQPNSPSLLGLEASGVVEKVGLGVEGFKTGDEVCLTPNITPTEYGFLGDYILAPVKAVIKKPKSLSFKQAAAVWMTYGTAYANLVLRGGLEKGANQTVLISAASSGVGTASIQMAKRYDAKVIATTRTSEKKEFLKALGADLVIATEEENLVEAVQEYTQEKGFDIAMDAIADSDFMGQLIETAAFEAKIVVYGALALNPMPSFPLFPMLIKGVSIQGLHYVFQTLEIEERFKQMKEDLFQGFESKKYVPMVDKIFSLEQIQDAYNYMASNKQKGKILVTTDFGRRLIDDE
ncbi:zinc-binding dehydrogenase [Aggregatimonas sangjinii]|uniref:Zinc-binding dehydrogenase n=1 Tax=Aggregatimonas sangjinii TaxID=2583587 RepID=A0A5B7SLI1_9FLAO|nr:zinc-dependent alcohol dehydrogenase family protein [Aggregatimonas sangjinii]QCW99434.1 zinc-binding dehydrogenase [Aggregatimonas sangjinii]